MLLMGIADAQSAKQKNAGTNRINRDGVFVRLGMLSYDAGHRAMSIKKAHSRPKRST
jgi:hypothetical protein